MNTETTAYDFEDIRPLNNDEVPQAIKELVNDQAFKDGLKVIMPGIDYEELAKQMLASKTKEEFKATFSYNAVMAVAKQTAFSLTISGRSRLPENPCTFISNHRDIVLDVAFLNVLMYDVGHGLTQVAIGDNLLVRPWIKTLVRLNNSFIVKRNVPMRQMLETSKTLSAYIHHTIKETKESLWIAQREGRAKDSDDRTQNSVLKMLNLGGTGDILTNLRSLNIVPISISYEYDPCDYLKAKEFQQKRIQPDFQKSPYDDLISMRTGILGYKGRVHFTICDPLDPQISTLDPKMEKNELYSAIAHAIDLQIFKYYRFYPCNYIAYDWLNGTRRFNGHYSLKDKKEFEEYVQKQLDKIDLPEKDDVFLRTKMLEMYSNPLKNNLTYAD
ncbi:1-acyl-sn-glycerol-3-phosphate acyltransferase [Parabacteroides sp. Marseille-P3160]|uniref:1-acyl-sn-glycerol-3-phosphate acyltransferase n=1 Tax=Parabacteroides sp. Marseille-P3160 TaxID=1917887 RepID=UPI0009BA0CC6|nr:1-acyl-sn-glycerol-3-phosphate acyltransferase [Parabacteroides sp. Marseille-P3160]